MSEIRRLWLVRESGEPRLSGTAAVRRYRLGRLEEIAEATPADRAVGGAQRQASPPPHRRAV